MTRALQRRVVHSASDEKTIEKLQRRDEYLSSLLEANRGMYPLNALGMPPPGPDFLRLAESEEDGSLYEQKTVKGRKQVTYTVGPELARLYRRALFTSELYLSVSVKPGYDEIVRFIPGHLWGTYYEMLAAGGPYCYIPPGGQHTPVEGPRRPADVMIIGKAPKREELDMLANLVGPGGMAFQKAVSELRIEGASSWYVTNLCKFRLPGGATTLKSGWIADCLPLLHQELRLVRPKYILCLGADPTKALLGKKFNVGYMEGRALEYKYQLHATEDDPEMIRTAQVMAVISPNDISGDASKEEQFKRGLSRFSFLIDGNKVDEVEKDIDHRIIRTYEEAKALIKEILDEFHGVSKRDRLVAWDAEWHGNHAVNDDAYMRTIQISWKPKHAACFVICAAGGKKVFRNEQGKLAIRDLMSLLQDFANRTRAVGHFLVADLEYMRAYGLDPTENCLPPLDPDPQTGRTAWERFRDGEGWLDTSNAMHAIEETSQLGLEVLSARFTGAPRYDIPLEDWKKGILTKLKVSGKHLEGYGDCPDEILIPYGNYDADVTMRIIHALLPRLEHDHYGNTCWEAFWESMLTMRPISAMRDNGIGVDKNRIDEFSVSFLEARSSLEEQIKNNANWDTFNIRSVQHVKEYLFGEELNGKVGPEGEVVRIRPENAVSLYLQPELDTNKPPKRWAEHVMKGTTHKVSPSTSKMVLGLLRESNPDYAKEINSLRDHRFIDQVLKQTLRPPKLEASGFVEDDNGNLVYDGGLYKCICSDGRVRTSLRPTAETGRWKSSNPNLQNFSKQRDPDYVRLLGDKYKKKLRSILTADPGYAFIEFDYMGAELYGMAIMAGDKLMIEHSVRALHPDEGFDEHGNRVPGGKYPHPDYYDIHSNIAKLAFHLDCLPTKAGLKAIGKSHFRILAKNVIFGVAYGRQAKALALAAREQGINVTEKDTQQVIDAIFNRYNKLPELFAEARTRATSVGWISSCFGRFRRFPTTNDEKQRGEFERQAMNFPIQSMVASCVDRGLARMQHVIEQQGLQDEIRMILQIHDAGLLEVKHEHIPYVVEDLIPYCMQKCVPIYPTNLAGEPREGDGPYYLGLDVVVEKRWGEKYTKEECAQYGIPMQFASAS